MATYRELLQRLEWYVDDVVDDNVALMLFSQANEDLSPVAGYIQKKDQSYDPATPVITLPDDFFNLIELKLKRNSDTGYLRLRPINLVQPNDLYTPDYMGDGEAGDYEILGNTVEIRHPWDEKDEAGTLSIRYYANLPKITDLATSPVISSIYHDAYALFAAAKWWQNYQDELDAKTDFMGEYYTKRQQLESETSRWKEKTKSKTVYQFRPWY